MSNGANSALDKAANDANQNMSSAPACSPTQACGAAPPAQTTISPTKTSWVSIELVGDDGKPVPGEAYQITLPDGSVVQGSLDEKGRAKVNGFDPGTCKVTFPNLDKDAWSSK
ncbi:MAG: hypothetical protein WBR10_14110 [Candidatus Acidiferrum sp.]